MQVKNLEITEIKITKYNHRTNTLKIQISFSNDEPYTTEMLFENDMQGMILKLLTRIKKEKKPIDHDDDPILGGISIININNDEQIIEKAYKGLIRVDQKLNNWKRTNIASEYMRMYNQINTMQEVIYRKN